DKLVTGVQTCALPISALAPVSRVNTREALPFEQNVARDIGGTHQPRERFHQFRLTISFDACNADDFCGSHLERDVLDDSDALWRSEERRVGKGGPCAW